MAAPLPFAEDSVWRGLGQGGLQGCTPWLSVDPTSCRLPHPDISGACGKHPLPGPLGDCPPEARGWVPLPSACPQPGAPHARQPGQATGSMTTPPKPSGSGATAFPPTPNPFQPLSFLQLPRGLPAGPLSHGSTAFSWGVLTPSSGPATQTHMPQLHTHTRAHSPHPYAKHTHPHMHAHTRTYACTHTAHTCPHPILITCIHTHNTHPPCTHACAHTQHMCTYLTLIACIHAACSHNTHSSCTHTHTCARVLAHVHTHVSKSKPDSSSTSPTQQCGKSNLQRGSPLKREVSLLGAGQTIDLSWEGRGGGGEGVPVAGTACVQVFCDPGRAPQMLSEGSSKLTWMLRALLWVVCPGRRGTRGKGRAGRLLESPRELSSNPT